MASELVQAQWDFAYYFGQLLTWINEQEGYNCAIGEVQRTQEQAQIYARTGKGSLHSLHISKLAGDVLIFKDGVYLEDSEDYEFAGVYWESLDPDLRWGGRFKNKDGNHFSHAFGGYS